MFLPSRRFLRRRNRRNRMAPSAAIDAVRRWRYRPARLGERPVAVSLNVVVTFLLRNV